jgi:hypothetical protein
MMTRTPTLSYPYFHHCPSPIPKRVECKRLPTPRGSTSHLSNKAASSLYPVLALRATSLEVVRILLSIGGVEVNHFSLWHDKCGNATAEPLAGPNGLTDPETGLTFPDFNSAADQHNAKLSASDQAAGSQMFQTNLILPEPVEFLSKDLPPVSITRPTLARNGGAVATIQAFIADNLFLGQKDQRFFQTMMGLARAADDARRDLDS